MEDDKEEIIMTNYEIRISIHVPRVEDDSIRFVKLQLVCISIHVPRVEDDEMTYKRYWERNDFNPRPPCGGRLADYHKSYDDDEFQSTSPVWRTTHMQSVFPDYPCDFNPRPPCGGRQSCLSKARCI